MAKFELIGVVGRDFNFFDILAQMIVVAGVEWVLFVVVGKSGNGWHKFNPTIGLIACDLFVNGSVGMGLDIDAPDETIRFD